MRLHRPQPLRRRRLPPPPAPAPAPVVANAKCDNPNALGVERIVQIDTTGGPGFGFEHFKAYDFLRDHEVVLTFDDGPWPGNTERVLKALADNCTKALFFPIGKHAGWHPEILKEVAKAGHTIGSHTWSHKDLTKLTPDEAKAEIEKGIAAVSIALGNKPVGPFFRFPALRHPPEMVKYLGERNVGIFSTDMDSFDFKIHKPEQVIKSVMTKLEKHGKGIILMHDFQHGTSEAAAGTAQAAQGRRLQGGAGGRQDADRAAAGIQGSGAQGDGRRAGRGAPDVERDPDHPGQLIVPTANSSRPREPRAAGFLWRGARGFMQHGLKGLEDLFHLRPLVGKQIGRIHRVHDHCGAHFEHQELAVPRLGAIDRQIVEPGALGDGLEGRRVPDGEVVVEIRHEARFFGAPCRIVPSYWH